jgi:hypothetical protein
MEPNPQGQAMRIGAGRLRSTISPFQPGETPTRRRNLSAGSHPRQRNWSGGKTFRSCLMKALVSYTRIISYWHTPPRTGRKKYHPGAEIMTEAQFQITNTEYLIYPLGQHASWHIQRSLPAP